MDFPQSAPAAAARPRKKQLKGVTPNAKLVFHNSWRESASYSFQLSYWKGGPCTMGIQTLPNITPWRWQRCEKHVYDEWAPVLLWGSV